jgi:hypothetical protein
MHKPTPARSDSFLRVWPLIGLCAICGITVWTKWVKLVSLLFMDSAWWLHEAARFAWGDVPYRDFYWPYGPLSIAVLSYPMRWFGVRFDVAQIVLDILSVVIVVLFTRVMRYLLPPPLHLVTAILFVCIGATAQTYFSLFSILSYTPSVHVGALGMLLLLLGLFRYLDGGFTPLTVGIIALGTWICCLGKQETFLASIALLILLAICDRRLPVARYLWLGGLCIAPPMIIYFLLMAEAGPGKFLACVQAFGLATNACPWWPTGLGILGAFSALGQASVVMAFSTLINRERWRQALGRRLAWLWIAAALGTAFYLKFEWRLWSMLVSGSGSFFKRATDAAPELLSSSAILRPAMWCSILYWLYLVWVGVRSGFRFLKDDLRAFLLLTVVVVMGVRSLFGSILVSWPEVPAIAYPFLLLAGPYLLFRCLRYPYPQSPGLAGNEWIPAALTGSLMLLYAIVRLAGGYAGFLSDRHFIRLHTQAGDVRLKEGSVESQIYDYVMRNTAPTDSILEVPFGGAMQVATGRRSHLYSTLFIQLRPPSYIRAFDLQAIQRHPPEVVIAPDEEHLGTTFGIKGRVGCAFPDLVWQPDRISWDPVYVLPIIQYIEQHYRVDQKIGPWLLWRPLHRRP